MLDTARMINKTRDDLNLLPDNNYMSKELRPEQPQQ